MSVFGAQLFCSGSLAGNSARRMELHSNNRERCEEHYKKFRLRREDCDYHDVNRCIILG
jgi:hypothetical protein